MNSPRVSALRRVLFKLAPLLLLLGAGELRAQEFSFQAGGTGTPNLRTSSYSWELDYTQRLARYFSGSVSWINEGHLIGHHRDGTAGQLWVALPLLDDRLTLSAGAGAYYYFDTQTHGGGDSLDVHGTAPIYSLAATGYLTDRWFARFVINRINPHGDFHSNTALLGLGYWFGQDRRPKPDKLGAAPEDQGFVTGTEFTGFLGMSVVNAAHSEHSASWAVEFRQGLRPHLDGAVTYIYEGDPKLTRRSGLGLQICPVNTFFHGRIAIGLGVGVYVYIDNKHPQPDQKLPFGGSFNTPAMAPLLSPTFAVRVSDSWVMRAMWHRVVTNYNRDSDVFLLGAGFRWR
ncbi:MAG TPA: hypothetical protein VG936_05455 [Lacunisphaera sp.]|nr:hypothetical protein [Lacunisphaera sp.]